MRTFLSYLGLVLLAFGLVLLGGDLMTTLEHNGEITFHSFKDIWALFDAGAVAAFTAWMNKTLPQFLTTSVVAVLSVPAVATGFIGVIIAFFAGRRHEDE